MAEIIADFELASGQSLNPAKSTALLFGTQQTADLTGLLEREQSLRGIRWLRYGTDDADVGLGIRIGTDAQVQQYERILHES
eukprot:3017732-Prymnesium_polylepis.1